MNLLSKQRSIGGEPKEVVCSNAMQVTGNPCLTHVINDAWIIDSGTSDHMSYNLDFFSICKPLNNKNHCIIIKNGNRVKMNFIGDVRIHKDILLKGFLYVPCFKYNPISVNKCIKDMHCKVVFTINEYIMQGNLMKMPLLLGKARSTLYYLHNDTSKDVKATRHAANANLNEQDCQKLHKLKLWHIRLGNLPFNKIQLIFH